MANVHKPDENIKTDVATVYVSLNNTASPAIYFSMQNYDLAWYIIHCHANAGGTLSCQMWQRVGAAGALAVLKAAATTLVAAGALDVSLFARGEDFTATYTYWTYNHSSRRSSDYYFSSYLQVKGSIQTGYTFGLIVFGMKGMGKFRLPLTFSHKENYGRR